MKISKRFSREEFACSCGCGFSTADHELIETLEACADHFHSIASSAVERVAVTINSGCRCANHDRAIKLKLGKSQNTAKPSEHLRGWAADFYAEWVYSDQRIKIPDDDIADWLEANYIGRFGIGRYNGRTHLDTRTGPSARWDNR